MRLAYNLVVMHIRFSGTFKDLPIFDGPRLWISIVTKISSNLFLVAAALFGKSDIQYHLLLISLIFIEHAMFWKSFKAFFLFTVIL